MKYEEDLSKLSELPYFDQVTVGNLIKITGKTLQIYLDRAVARGQFIRLKRGLYVTGDYYKLVKTDQGYFEFISNIIYGPSYLSLEYVLQKYAILTESVYSYTAITTKKPIKIINKIGNYFYTNIDKSKFIGFEIVKKGNYQIRQATKAKALYDYLYFAIKSWKTVSSELVDRLRLNLDEINSKDWVEFEGYVNKFSGKKMRKVKKILCNQ